ncbi:hypothetical protein BUALT_Bualt10G0027900 [Buddleja alternifolia]|uniref:Bifunctional inhibitor/plant lipid transfer protein/seed storage helical domain-containing protein n=1 Tax=Buddleja alternifolia TaxID=168488 RepID=A0AAV6X2T6_9LAMI|nr:hypothetical protein BUALT_Bualt10G0027900 [Buddleja alternifolia]
MARNSIVIFLSLNLLFFTLVSGQKVIPSSNTNTCPKDTLKFGLCADLLNWLINIRIGNPPKDQCCGLINELVDLEAAACLCTAIKANVLGIIHINISVALTSILSTCGKGVPSGFQCA